MNGLDATTDEREEVLTASAEKRRVSIVDILLLPVGVVAGLLISTFPLSLPVLYAIALLFVK